MKSGTKLGGSCQSRLDDSISTRKKFGISSLEFGIRLLSFIPPFYPNFGHACFPSFGAVICAQGREKMHKFRQNSFWESMFHTTCYKFIEKKILGTFFTTEREFVGDSAFLNSFQLFDLFLQNLQTEKNERLTKL